MPFTETAEIPSDFAYGNVMFGGLGNLKPTSNTVYGQTCCNPTLCEEERPSGGGGGGERAQRGEQGDAGTPSVELRYPLALAPPRPNPARVGAQVRWSTPPERAGERFQVA